MQENNKKDEDNHGRDVDKFRDNAEGTTSLKEFLEQVGRCGENVAGRTGKNIYTGNQGTISQNTLRDEITQIYDDLVVARARGSGYDRDAYEYGEADEDGIARLRRQRKTTRRYSFFNFFWIEQDARWRQQTYARERNTQTARSTHAKHSTSTCTTNSASSR